MARGKEKAGVERVVRRVSEGYLGAEVTARSFGRINVEWMLGMCVMAFKFA